MKKLLLGTIITVGLTGFSSAAVQKKSCDELKAEIAAKLDAKGVKNYTLEIVAAEDVKEAKVVGTCDGGAKRITYMRN